LARYGGEKREGPILRKRTASAEDLGAGILVASDWLRKEGDQKKETLAYLEAALAGCHW